MTSLTPKDPAGEDLATDTTATPGSPGGDPAAGAVRVVDVIADLAVPDLAAAREFYADYLGLSVEEFNLGWVARYTSPASGAHLQLVTADATAPVAPAVSVKVVDVAAAYAAARERGYEIVHPLTREEWGVHRFFVRAPDGTVLNIVEHHT